MRRYLFEMMTDKPPIRWTRTRETIYLGDSDESRRIVVKCLRNGLQPGEINEVDCPRIRIDPGRHSRGF